MTDVPETVWVMPSNDGWLSPYCGIIYYRGALAYRRADLPATDAQAMQNDKVKALVEALEPFANVGIGTDQDYQPMIRMDRDAIVAARAAIAAIKEGNDNE